MSNHSHLLHPSHNGAPVILRVDNVGRTYSDGAVTALADVSLEIRRGEYVAIMGPSGSGKSTLLNLLGTLDRPTTGELYFEGQPLSQLQRFGRFSFAQNRLRISIVLSAADADGRGKRANSDVRNRHLAGAAREKSLRTAGIGQHGASGQSFADATFGRRTAARGHCPALWRTIRRCCWPTSRPATSIRAPATTCSICSTNCTASKAKR